MLSESVHSTSGCREVAPSVPTGKVPSLTVHDFAGLVPGTQAATSLWSVGDASPRVKFRLYM